ncbi:MAG: response regulator transcription factor [Gammaproteobacteria bacterium]|nr:response regulator transcription factor [Gammaproteobacteria bacterium]
MTRKPKLLIVEDEAAIRDGLVDVFVYHGFDVESRGDGAAGLDEARTGRYDLVLLDVMLPGMNGFDVCDAIRAEDRDQPIIMLTAKGSDEEIIHGLTLGADDYVAKPFSIQQLVLRVKAVLRRSEAGRLDGHTITLVSGVVVDTGNLSGRAGETELAFTRREIDILRYLAANAGRAVSREELLNKVWGYARNLGLETRTVDIHVAKLRRKIEANPKEPANLITVRRAGYRLLLAGA